ncbi:MAG TPA: hypothetical protein VFP69_10950, partial [Streptomyces sp.]|nr:hypothetical protein [Streptomyces sp.]
IALQALRHGDVLIVDGGGTGEYACLAGRDGVLGVELGLEGALERLEWAARETERRLIAANRARQAGAPPPEDTGRPLWIILDRPTAFTHLAAADGGRDPQSLLPVPLRHGRAANVTVVVADQLDGTETLGEAVLQHTRARVVLGPAAPEQLTAVLGIPPETTQVPQLPPGRGYARLGTGPVHRLQVPATPDPYDETTSETHRRAVLALLPPRTTPADATNAADPVDATRTADTADTAGAPGSADATSAAATETVPVPTGAAPDRVLVPEGSAARPVPVLEPQPVPVLEPLRETLPAPVPQPEATFRPEAVASEPT